MHGKLSRDDNAKLRLGDRDIEVELPTGLIDGAEEGRRQALEKARGRDLTQNWPGPIRARASPQAVQRRLLAVEKGGKSRQRPQDSRPTDTLSTPP